MRMIDLNADLGEGGADDAALLDLVTSANIACGGHAGNDEIMRRTLDLCRDRGVAIGAHPGYEDRENFGRREMSLPLEQVTDLVARQVARLAEFSGNLLHHVKPHGALYNQANRDAALAAAVIEGVLKISTDVVLYAPPTGALAAAGRAAGLIVRGEGFADRRYQADGLLVPRSEQDAVISEIDEAVVQAIELANDNLMETLCIHGDGPHAAALLGAIRAALENAGLTVSHQFGNGS